MNSSLHPDIGQRCRTWASATARACLVAAALAAAVGCGRTSSSGGRPALALSEVMAQNSSVPVVDGAGDEVFQPWVEIHNPTAEPVSLNTYSLTDDSGRPRRFHFEGQPTLEPGGYRLVFLFDEQNCLDDCQASRRSCDDDCAAATTECEADCAAVHEACLAAAGDDLEAREACDATRDACRTACAELSDACDDVCADAETACERNCQPQGLVAGFGLDNETESIFLYADDGGALADRLVVRNQVEGTSNGIDPDSGVYGVMYLPTPAASNRPIDLKAHRFNAFPAVSPATDCAQPVAVSFQIARDKKAADQAPLSVFLEHVVVDACNASIEGKPIASDSLDPVQVDPTSDSTRLDPAGKPVPPVEVLLLGYEGSLPPAVCGSRCLFRVRAVDPLAVVTSSWECYEYGAAPVTVVVNEYQPRNTQILFQQYGSDGALTDPEVDPDWIEIHNYGDAPIDIRAFGIVSGGDLAAGKLDRWLFGREGKGKNSLSTAPLEPYVVPPKGFVVVLADNDDGSDRRTYYRVEDSAKAKPFYSTRFRLDPSRTPPNAYDEFALVDSSPPGKVLDRVVLDFSQNGYDLAENESVGRFEDVEGTAPNVLRPGTITPCPTFLAPNARTCDVTPVFEEVVTRETATGAHCPGAGDVVTVRSKVSFDAETPPDKIRVEFRYSLNEGAQIVLTGPPGLVVARADSQFGAAPGGILYDVTALVPAQPAGTLVTFSLLAQDLFFAAQDLPQGDEVIHDAAAAPRVSFRYVSGYAVPPDRPRINEVLPANKSLTLPPFACQAPAVRKYPDYAEIYNPADAPVDLSGYFLTNELSDSTPIARARLWEFPSGSIAPPRGVLPLYFAGAPECLTEEEKARYIEVEGFNLGCAETLYLIAPDDPTLGANCIVDVLSWNLTTLDPDDLLVCKEDLSFGRLCDGGDLAKELPGEFTPAATNTRPTLFFDAFVEVLSAPPGSCAQAAIPVRLRAVFFVDAKFPLPRGREGAFLVDMGAGEQEFIVTLFSTVNSDCTIATGLCVVPPPNHVSVEFAQLLSPLQGGFPPVVTYRVRFTDPCGVTREEGPFSFGTTTGQHPQLVINEANRSFPPVPGGDPVSWIEIHNPTDSDVDISGLYITDDIWSPHRSVLPEGSVLGPRGFVVVVTEGPAQGETLAASLDWAGQPGALTVKGTLYLFDSLERGTCLLDSMAFDFTGAGAGSSAGRFPDGSDTVQLLGNPTPGAANSVASSFLRGDANEDLQINVSDMIRSLGILFLGDDRTPRCLDALDANDDGGADATDPVFLGNFLFRVGPPIPLPFPEPGLDPTVDAVTTCSTGA